MTKPTSPDKTLYLIDGHAHIFRAYHAIRALSSPVTNEPTNAVFGFVGMLLKLYRQYRPHYVVLTLDVSGDKKTFRSEIYPQYKANRKAPPEDLPGQVQRIIEIAGYLSMPVMGVVGYEADDVIATVCHKLKGQSGLRIRIVSGDKDLQQLIDTNVAMFNIYNDEEMGLAALKAEKGLTPRQVGDMLCLCGDSIDNVPGVAGVGPKTAAKLISQYGDIDNLLAHSDELTGKLKENIEKAKATLPMCRKLIALRPDVPIEFRLQDAQVGVPHFDRLHALFKQLGFAKHLRELELWQQDLMASGAIPAQTVETADADRSKGAPAAAKAAAPFESSGFGGLFDGIEGDVAIPSERPLTPTSAAATADPGAYTAITTAKQLDELARALTRHAKAGGVISVDTETDSIDPMRARLCGISFAWEKGKGVYIPVCSPDPSCHLPESQVLDKLRPLLEDPGTPKCGQNLKYDMLVLRNAGVRMRGVAFDTMVASYLIEPERSSHALDNLALAYLNHEMIPITRLIGSGKNQCTMNQVALDKVTVYSGEDADIALRLVDILTPQLKARGLRDLFDKLEMPLVDVLAELQFNGIRVDPAELDRQKAAIAQRIDQLHKEIQECAGRAFNPDSPKQLAQVLFTDLKCKPTKRTKTGPSTDVEVLQRIADEQEPPGATLAGLVLEYRQLTKLMGTYLESLKEAIHPKTHRIHASFNQTVTATGRLSSSDPNLQNIPIRSDIGRQIRKAFVADKGHVLLSADYSQIELRILAHLSQDPGLIEAFAQDLDIHAAVASEVFNTPLEQVTGEQRAVAKMVNFGIVYGITPYGLARRLANTSSAASDVEVAKKVITDYRAKYPRIGQFLDRCIETAKSKGYVSTMLNRRRNIPQINSTNAQVRALGERLAINAVVQGSAADLMKLAMLNIFQRTEREGLPLKMLLQIHDELVFEVPSKQAQPMGEVVKAEMTGAMELSVPLKVGLGWGGNWAESK